MRIGCCHPDGRISRYQSVKEAADANGIGCEVQLRHHIWTISNDTQGRLWWDD